MSQTRPPRRPWPRRPFARPAIIGALALLAAAPAAQANPPRCPTPAEQSMFEVAALKTELMVVAVDCKVDERYNEFIRRFRPQLIENDRDMNAHFERRFGRGNTGKRAMDTYITNLAQARAFAGQKLGGDFCPRNTQLFNEVMALPGGNDLAAYAAAKEVIPDDLPGCATAATAASAPARAARPARAAAAPRRTPSR